VSTVSSSGIPMGSPTYATARVVLVLFFLIGLNFFCSRHLGIGWDAPVFSLLLAGAGAGVGILEAYWGESEWKATVTRLARKIVRVPLLLGLCAALLIAAGVCSSLTVLVDPPDTLLSAMLKPADNGSDIGRAENNLGDPKSPIRFLHVWTTPLGRPYQLEVKGYLPQIIQVYPLVGATVSPRRDLQVLPSVLFRPPEVALGPMAGKVCVQIFDESASGKALVAENRMVGPNSFLLGTEQNLPSSQWESWRLEVLAKGIKDEIALAKVLEAWRFPQVLSPTGPIRPGDYLDAIVYNASGQPIATARVKLTQEKLQDVPLHSIGPDSSMESRLSSACGGGQS
jgi:hypothetical protein